MNKVLARWNSLDHATAAREALPCCGSHAWATGLASARPVADESSLIETSAAIWQNLPEQAWQEAFDSHPRIGQNHAQTHATDESLRWSAQEQRALLTDDHAAKLALEAANRLYEQRFGRIFIICAIGKTSAEILTTLQARMQNDAATELHEAAEQQRQITQLRLHHWLESK
ncbi:2-oxo-4-hydroxy-4-carboxy-5-ureidoimidazoline decarboxylase [Tunturiibacter empetritectus]|uniref:2-oxo-4-hydroxy-4-carboxy-5-ureidoimidazoline decarboxylase n=1 Tax=Tunturiibacter lichenicola TaxID=2051959 RepID=A0A852VGX5_9BACT|nr:2-oxo-4-hydroxy-4-carboxy-5-ureidoimidazoline decarboxylase [Edaphobacter lichenicola]NYF88792.1 2-oxo-4-hydroxy-4-carboxy-5-ureidoimidazoline decarboxylase [Edaphobacter lichenicola]